jgi:hypothetical protein
MGAVKKHVQLLIVKPVYLEVILFALHVTYIILLMLVELVVHALKTVQHAPIQHFVYYVNLNQLYSRYR